MKRIFLSALVALIIPLSASALSVDEIRAQIQTLMQQIQQLQEQMKILTTPTTTPPVACTMDAKICPDGSAVGRIGPRCEFAACPGGGGPETPPAWCIKYEKLTYGTRGAEVVALQGAIGAEDLGSTPTGYYGSLTKSIWDRKCRKECPVYEYNYACPAGQHMVTDRNNCNKPSCVPDGITPSPLAISGVSGPPALAVGEQGTWTVKAVATSTGTLSYRVTWGDEGPFAQIAALADNGESFTQSATFTHTYARAGTYTVRFTVRDSAGKTADASLTVRVGTTPANVCPAVAFISDCAPGYHPMNKYGDNGCVVGNSCVPDGPITTNSLPSGTPRCVGPMSGGIGYGQDINCTPTANAPVVTDNSGPTGGGMGYPTPAAPVANTSVITDNSGPTGGGMGYPTPATCTANGMTFAEGATVSQCIASGGAYGCNTFTVVEPRFVCRGGVWVQ